MVHHRWRSLIPCVGPERKLRNPTSRILHPRLQEVLLRESGGKTSLRLEDLVATLDEIQDIYKTTAMEPRVEEAFVTTTQRQPNRESRMLRPRLCFYCKEPGHIIANCKKRKSSDHVFTNVKRFYRNPTQNEEKKEFICIAAALVTEASESVWILDSGATRHMVNDVNILKGCQDLAQHLKIVMANDNYLNGIC